MINIIEKISKELSDLKIIHNDLNVAGVKLDEVKLEKLKNGLNRLESEFTKITIKDELHFFVSSIQHSLAKLERGINDTDTIKSDAEKANEVLNNYIDLKDGIKTLSEDTETLISYSEYEKNTSRSASIVHILDKVASSLEVKGLLREAWEIDIISNTIEASEAPELNKLAIELTRPNRTGEFIQTISTIRADRLGSHQKVLPIVRKVKNMKPIDAVTFVGDSLGWGIDSGAYRAAIRILDGTSEELPTSAGVPITKEAGNSALAGMTAFFLALCSGVSRRSGAGDRPAQEWRIIELNKLLRIIKNKIDEPNANTTGEAALGG